MIENYQRVVSGWFAGRVAERRAAWQLDKGNIQGLPQTVGSEGEAGQTYCGINALILLQLMHERGFDDPRFVTADEVVRRGLAIKPGASFAKVVHVDWTVDVGGMSPDVSVAKVAVYNGSDIEGLAPLVPGAEQASAVERARYVLEQAGVPVVHADDTKEAFYLAADGTVYLPPVAAFPSVEAYCAAAIHELGHALLDKESPVGEPGSAAMELRAEMASTMLSVAMGLPHDLDRHADYASKWAALLENDPAEIFRAARDADRLVALVLWHAHQLEVEKALGHEGGRERSSVAEDLAAKELGHEEVAPERKAPRKERDRKRRHRYSDEEIEALFEERQAVLGVPYEERFKPGKLGAEFSKRHKLWFVPAGVDIAPLEKWVSKDQVVQRAVGIDEIKRDFVALADTLDVIIDPEKIIADGRWHNVRVSSKKGKNTAGGYRFSENGGTRGEAIGCILNRHTGAYEGWSFQGEQERLSPEELARRKAYVKEQAILEQERELRLQEVCAKQAVAIWEKATDAKGGYLDRKGVDNHGFRVIDGAELLKCPAFIGETGKSVIKAGQPYTIIPMFDLDGKLWAVQPIGVDGQKSFMRNGRKSGLVCVIDEQGAMESPADLGLDVGKVALTEGVATGATWGESTGVKTVICFDAGNMEKVAELLSKRLSPACQKIVAGDNDLYFPERALEKLKDEVGIPLSGGSEPIAVRVGVSASRKVDFGGIAMDGQWHPSSGGRYRVTPEITDGVIEKLKVETDNWQKGGEKTAYFGNRGREAALVAQEKLGQGAVVVLPEFADMRKRPTDWNDLAATAGKEAVRAQAGKVILLGKFAAAEQVVEKKVAEIGR